MGLGLGIKLNLRKLVDTGIPFTSDLLATYLSRTGNVINEESGNDGLLMPAAGFYNNTIDYIDTGIKLSGNSFDMTMWCKKVDGGLLAITQGAISIKRTSLLWGTDNKIYGLIGTDSEHRFGVTAALTNFDFKKIRLVYDGAGATDVDKIKLYVDDVYVAFDSITGPIPSLITTPNNNLEIGPQYDGGATHDGLITKVLIEGVIEYHITGKQLTEYDVSDNGNDGTWVGAAQHYAYDANGSRHASDNGYSLYQHATDPDIQVPYLASGTPIISPTVPGGYTLTRNVAGGGITNRAEALVDFDPDDNTPAALAILDRSNTTYQTAASRALDDYDSGNPFRYHVKNISDYDIYKTLFETDYIDRFFSKVSDILSISEMLLYATKKVGAALATVKSYCNIS